MILSYRLKEGIGIFVSTLGGGVRMKERRIRVILFAVVLCSLLMAPLFVATSESCCKSVNEFTTSTGDYPTPSGDPFFTLHIVVPQESPIPIHVGEIISESLHDIGIEGVVHPLPFFPMLYGLYPEEYGFTQYGIEQPGPPGAPELVTVEEYTVMQGYDIAFQGLNFDDKYGCWNGFSIGHSDDTYNQGYSNPEFDALYEELESLPIDWDDTFPDPPDLSSSDGVRALEILDELQAIWAEDQPYLVHHNRIQWSDDGLNGFAVSPWNLANKHLANPEIRRAINLALNRQAILDYYAYEPTWEATVVQTWLAPWHPGFNPDYLPVYDPEEGLKILTDIFIKEAINDIGDQVQSLVDSGVLKTGVGNALTRKLDDAIGHLEKDNPHAASQNLGNFIDQINSLVNSGRLSGEDGDELIAMAQAVIDWLGGS
jgi:hypothetical protein